MSSMGVLSAVLTFGAPCTPRMRVKARLGAWRSQGPAACWIPHVGSGIGPVGGGRHHALRLVAGRARAAQRPSHDLREPSRWQPAPAPGACARRPGRNARGDVHGRVPPIPSSPTGRGSSGMPVVCGERKETRMGGSGSWWKHARLGRRAGRGPVGGALGHRAVLWSAEEAAAIVGILGGGRGRLRQARCGQP